MLNSLWPLLSGLACCAIEMMSTATSRNDIDRWGMFPFRASPRQADVLIVAGTLTTKMAEPLIRLWEEMPEPKWVVAMGDCTCSGGRYKRSYSTIQGIDRILPVDVYIPGCPPRPEGLIYGMMKLQQLVKRPPRPLAGAQDRPHRAGGDLTVDRAFKALLERKLGSSLEGPVRQRHDQTEIRIRPGDVPQRHAHAPRRAGPALRVPGRPLRRGHRDDLPGRLPPVERGHAGLAAGHRRRDPPRRAARSLADLPLEGRRVDGARGLRHVRPHLRGEPRPAPDLPAGRLRELPAPQGLPPRRRRRPLARRRDPSDGAARTPRADADETTLRRTSPGV